MNAGYLYDIFATTEKTKAPDLYTGLAVLQQSNPVRDPDKLKEIREFLGRHYDTLIAAYQPHDRDSFATAVAECVKLDAEREATNET